MVVLDEVIGCLGLSLLWLSGVVGFEGGEGKEKRGGRVPIVRS